MAPTERCVAVLDQIASLLPARGLPDLPAPYLRAYPRETVVAEKFRAMATLRLTSGRMKDSDVVWVLSKIYNFDSERPVPANAATANLLEHRIVYRSYRSSVQSIMGRRRSGDQSASFRTQNR
jgi:hypothetical protein